MPKKLDKLVDVLVLVTVVCIIASLSYIRELKPWSRAYFEKHWKEQLDINKSIVVGTWFGTVIMILVTSLFLFFPPRR